jgi:ribosomal-protein-alanine N-acetyltransferase
MLEIKRINKVEDFTNITREEFIDFLFTHLGEFGDPKKDISKCLDYAFSAKEGEGGFALAAFYEGQLVGTQIMNKTGMGDYIPAWILVYVAIDANYRGKGFGEQIIKESFKHCDGRVKLHVEHDNPAKRLYERIGFTTEYAEMRYGNK